MSREILLLVDALAREKNVSKGDRLLGARIVRSRPGNQEAHQRRRRCARLHRPGNRRLRILPSLAGAARRGRENDEGPDGSDRRREEYPEIQVGDYVEEGLEPIDFGRIGAQAAKQVILQKVRDAEREQILNDFLERKEFIISGSIKRMERGNAIIEGAASKPCCPATR